MEACLSSATPIFSTVNKVEANHCSSQNEKNCRAVIHQEVKEGKARSRANHDVRRIADQVAVPPTFEAMISTIKNGTGLISSILHTVKVTGPISKTVVTLSKNADNTAVIRQNNTIIIQGLPFAIFAARMAKYSNMPEFFTTATKIIIPTRTPRVPSRYD